MRERIFSSVLLPAPLRPMMPTSSPAIDLEGHIAKGPDRAIAGMRVADDAEERSGARDQLVAQGGMPLSARPDPVLLAKMLRSQRHLVH